LGIRRKRSVSFNVLTQSPSLMIGAFNVQTQTASLNIELELLVP